MRLPLSGILAKHAKVGIAGAPRTGKTTLSKAVRDRPVIGTDAYKGEMEWSEIPHAMIRDTDQLGAFCIEGVQVGRALRKGLPLDCLIYLDRPMVEQSPGQEAMGKGIRTVLNDWASKAESAPATYIKDGDGFVEVPALEFFR